MKIFVRYLIVFIILAAFIALSSLYLNFYVVQKNHGIILFIANGLDLSLLQRARLQAAKKGQSLHLDRLNHIAITTTTGLNQNIADDGAAATALASGELIPNGYVGYNSAGNRLNTLIYAAQKAGRLTGIVTTNSLTANTPTAFYSAKKGDPDDIYRNAAELIDTSNIDLILGGGASHFTPATVKNPNGRLDRRNLINDAKKKGYEIVTTKKSLESIPRWPPRRVLGLFAQESFIYSTLIQGASEQPTLADLTRRGIELLNLHIGGYLLIIDHALIENAARNNFTQLCMNEISALDEAIGTAIAFAGKKSIVLCTSNFSLGALSIRHSDITPDIPKKQDTTYDWLCGPGGPTPPKPTQIAKNPTTPQTPFHYYQKFYIADPSLLIPQPAIKFSEEAKIISRPSWIAAKGFGQESFSGFIHATSIYDLILSLY